MKQHRNFVVAVMCLVFLSGCYKKVSENGSLTFSYQAWVPLLVAIAGVAALPVGIVLFRRKQRFWGVVLAIVGPLAAGVMAPGMYLDRVVVNQDGFYSRHGFWWDPTIHQIRYEELLRVQVVEEVEVGRQKRYTYFFDCSFKSGQQERVPLGDVMLEALPEIAEHFRKHDVPVFLPLSLQK